MNQSVRETRLKKIANAKRRMNAEILFYWYRITFAVMKMQFRFKIFWWQ